jgi:uncharacterized short protein YbdD (DUF466 family)
MHGSLYNHDDVPLDDDTTFVRERQHERYNTRCMKL